MYECTIAQAHVITFEQTPQTTGMHTFTHRRSQAHTHTHAHAHTHTIHMHTHAYTHIAAG